LPAANGFAHDNACLPAYVCVVFNPTMIADARLPSYRNSVAQHGATGDSRLRRNDRVLADLHVVGNLNEIVDLNALRDIGVLKGPTVDCRIQPISTSSPIATPPICGNFQWRPSPKT